jgi:putative transposase
LQKATVVAYLVVAWTCEEAPTMARPKTTDLRHLLTSLVPRGVLTTLAAEAGVGRRRRKVSVVALFWTLVLGFGGGRTRTLAGLRRAYERATRTTLVPSAFYDRFTPALVRFLKAVVARLLVQVAEPARELGGLLGSFRDVVLTDATVIRLHDLLERAFPACRTNHTLAALKLHAVLSVHGAGPRSIKVTSERVHDGPVFRVGRWVRDRLLLFDLAYFRFQLFSCIRRNGGFFIVRLKRSANPRVVALHRRWRGQSVRLLGERINDVLPRLQRQSVDVEVEVAFKRRVYGGVRHTDRERFRLVGVRDPLTHTYHAYLTNIPPERLSPEDIAQIYAARWTVELFFRELKRHYRAADMPSANRVVVEALVYAVLVTFVVSRALLAALRRRLGALGARVPEERWAALFAEVAGDLLKLVVRRGHAVRVLAKDILAALRHEAVDPNARRALLQARIESGVQYQHRISVGRGHA